jgi:hypothetical protein
MFGTRMLQYFKNLLTVLQKSKVEKWISYFELGVSLIKGDMFSTNLTGGRAMAVRERRAATSREKRSRGKAPSVSWRPTKYDDSVSSLPNHNTRHVSPLRHVTCNIARHVHAALALIIYFVTSRETRHVHAGLALLTYFMCVKCSVVNIMTILCYFNRWQWTHSYLRWTAIELRWAYHL